MTVEQSLKRINQRLAAIERHLLAADETMLTCKQAAIALGCTPGALRMRAVRGGIPCTRSKTGRMYFRKSDINKYLNLV